jgi:hypothetical protein
MRILALTRNTTGASFEQRVLEYRTLLEQHGLRVEPRTMPKGLRAQRRLRQEASMFDAVWWHKYLPSPLFSGGWSRLPIVFDYDDPIVLNSRSGSEKQNFTRRVKFARHVRRCAAVLAASDPLADYARPYNTRLHVVPMAVDLPDPLPPKPVGPLTLLWLGGRATFRYLLDLRPVLEDLGRQRPDVVLRVVGHEPLHCRPLHVDNRQWSPAEQRAALEECHIGLCPMHDLPWARGKCPYKVLQYMAYGMPWVGSAVGENIPKAGPAEAPRGLTATTRDQWLSSLLRLIDDATLRTDAGAAGRAHVQAEHDRTKLAERIAGIFRTLQ